MTANEFHSPTSVLTSCACRRAGLSAAHGMLRAAVLIGVSQFLGGSVQTGFELIVAPIKDPSVGIPIANLEAALGAPWASYEISLQSTAGELMQAVQVEIVGNSISAHPTLISKAILLSPRPTAST